MLFSVEDSSVDLAVVISVPVVVATILIVIAAVGVALCIILCRKRRGVRVISCCNHTLRNVYEDDGKMSYMSSMPQALSFSMEIDPIPVTVSDMTMTCTSGSGAGKPFLVQRTIARCLVLENEPIGGGRFGQVYLGHYQGEEYAIKKFFSHDEQSWYRESEIYSNVNIRHENILTCFATDIFSNEGVTELWLITQHHPRGSLYDELHQLPLTVRNTLRIILSACRGIMYLHNEIHGTQGKPAIAHRDIKSKNILVKNDGTCCIADFGLAVVQNSSSPNLKMPTNLREGTKRYLSPEVLSESIDFRNFQSFLKTDVYAFGLVMWEVCRKCNEGGRLCVVILYSSLSLAHSHFSLSLSHPYCL